MNNIPIISGVEINIDDEGRYSLNDLHKASGTGVGKAPAHWFRTKHAKELVSQIIDIQICTSPVKAIKGGTHQGTFAHKLLAISYAGWISPRFQLQVNQTFVDYKNGQLPQPHIEPRSRLVDLANEIESENAMLRQEVQDYQRKMEIYDGLISTVGSLTIRDTARQIDLRPIDLTVWLSSNGWIFKRFDLAQWIAEPDIIEAGLLEHRTFKLRRKNGSVDPINQVRITAKGIVKLAEIFHQERLIESLTPFVPLEQIHHTEALH